MSQSNTAKPRPRLLVAAGGTGGHLYPAIAVARSFIERNPGASVTFVGTDRGLESRIVPQAGFPLELTRSRPLRGGGAAAKLRGVVGLATGAWDSFRLLHRLRPHAVLGVGAYVSGPLTLCAAVSRYPTLILEPNASPGLANRLLAPFVDEAAIAWEKTRVHFGDKAILTGNPVRSEIARVEDYQPVDGIMRVLVFGGSQGSRVLNQSVVSALSALAVTCPCIRFTHQTGPNDFDIVRTAYEASGYRDFEVVTYIDDMARAYEHSDLVVCRAGATSCAELAAAGRGAILVPLPAAGGHQDDNARMMAEAGAARWLPESELIGNRLVDWLVELEREPALRSSMADNARRLARPDAAERVAERLEVLSARRMPRQ